jgi:guanylate kinase
MLSGPSCSGKDALISYALQEFKSITLPVLSTSRPRRPHETDGKDYFFVSMEVFQHSDSMVYYWQSHGFFYGYEKEKTAMKGNVILYYDMPSLDTAIHRPSQSVIMIIDVAPGILEARIRQYRNTEEVAKRLEDAQRWRQGMDAYKKKADHVIENNDRLIDAQKRFVQILRTYL